MSRDRSSTAHSSGVASSRLRYCSSVSSLSSSIRRRSRLHTWLRTLRNPAQRNRNRGRAHCRKAAHSSSRMVGSSSGAAHSCIPRRNRLLNEGLPHHSFEQRCRESGTSALARTGRSRESGAASRRRPGTGILESRSARSSASTTPTNIGCGEGGPAQNRAFQSP